MELGFFTMPSTRPAVSSPTRWMDEKLARRSMALMAGKVMPAVTKATAPRLAVA
jgi:hypothetical protein